MVAFGLVPIPAERGVGISNVMVRSGMMAVPSAGDGTGAIVRVACRPAGSVAWGTFVAERAPAWTTTYPRIWVWPEASIRSLGHGLAR
jgi:hypothetical protein